jgi:predicted dehydrogenase
MDPVEFVIIGGGWRTEYFLRLARGLPDRFVVRGVYVRDPVKGAKLTADWGVPNYQNLDELFAATQPLFAVISVRTVAPQMLAEMARRNIPSLCETPPAHDLEGLDQVNALTSKGARIQIAEQYIFQPLHSARLAVGRSGLLGTLSQTQVSYTQGYHCISLMRHYLGLKYESVKITARRFHALVLKGPDRAGPPTAEKIISVPQTLAWFEFENKLGVFDFEADQHRSYVRSDRLLLRGDRGEINQNRVRHVIDFRTPMEFDLERLDAGQNWNMEGFWHKGIVGGGRWWYQNPFPEARLTDDELAVATCLSKMTEYARGGNDFYSLSEASHDQYLSLMLEQAIEQGTTIEAHAQKWAK